MKIKLLDINCYIDKSKYFSSDQDWSNPVEPWSSCMRKIIGKTFTSADEVFIFFDKLINNNIKYPHWCFVYTCIVNIIDDNLKSYYKLYIHRFHIEQESTILWENPEIISYGHSSDRLFRDILKNNFKDIIILHKECNYKEKKYKNFKKFKKYNDRNTMVD